MIVIKDITVLKIDRDQMDLVHQLALLGELIEPYKEPRPSFYSTLGIKGQGIDRSQKKRSR